MNQRETNTLKRSLSLHSERLFLCCSSAVRNLFMLPPVSCGWLLGHLNGCHIINHVRRSWIIQFILIEFKKCLAGLYWVPLRDISRVSICHWAPPLPQRVEGGVRHVTSSRSCCGRISFKPGSVFVLPEVEVEAVSLKASVDAVSMCKHGFHYRPVGSIKMLISSKHDAQGLLCFQPFHASVMRTAVKCFYLKALKNNDTEILFMNLFHKHAIWPLNQRNMYLTHIRCTAAAFTHPHN